ncbi:MAG: hypothetical protein MUE85_13910 [Microscillaceae bacterium]|nr:hypothetical protein [Microscillaceae bacterium]
MESAKGGRDPACACPLRGVGFANLTPRSGQAQARLYTRQPVTRPNTWIGYLINR